MFRLRTPHHCAAVLQNCCKTVFSQSATPSAQMNVNICTHLKNWLFLSVPAIKKGKPTGNTPHPVTLKTCCLFKERFPLGTCTCSKHSCYCWQLRLLYLVLSKTLLKDSLQVLLAKSVHFPLLAVPGRETATLMTVTG